MEDAETSLEPLYTIITTIKGEREGEKKRDQSNCTHKIESESES